MKHVVLKAQVTIVILLTVIFLTVLGAGIQSMIPNANDCITRN